VLLLGCAWSIYLCACECVCVNVGVWVCVGASVCCFVCECVRRKTLRCCSFVHGLYVCAYVCVCEYVYVCVSVCVVAHVCMYVLKREREREIEETLSYSCSFVHDLYVKIKKGGFLTFL